MCCSLELLIIIKALLRILVEGLQVGYLWTLLEEVREVQIQLTDEHAKLGSPVSDMVHSDNIVAHELEDTTYAISLDGRAQVADKEVGVRLGSKWPTCMFFAMFGDEKSTKTRFFFD